MKREFGVDAETGKVVATRVTVDGQTHVFPDEGDQREGFENKVYYEHFVRSIKFVEGQQFANCSAKPKEELFARGEDGDYADEHISAMWFGWKLARGMVR